MPSLSPPPQVKPKPYALDDLKSAGNALREILDGDSGEQRVASHLKAHPQLLWRYFCSTHGHCDYVLAEVSLGGERKMDAVVLTGYSGAWEANYIEFEPVGDRVFNKDGTPSARIKGALKQIADWREYIRVNLSQFRRSLSKFCQTSDLLGRIDPKWEPCTYSNHRLKDPETFVWEHYWIVAGRRAQLSSDVRGWMSRQQGADGVQMVSYDGFLDVASGANPFGGS